MLIHLNKRRPFPLELHVESCGLGDWHVGHLPSEQMRHAAAGRGIVLSGRAKKFQSAYLYSFDYVLAADESVLHELFEYATSLEHREKIHLITEYSRSYHRQNIPDPYTQKEDAFELVLDMLEESCAALLQHINASI